MSHLKLKVNNQTPNNAGDITVNLSNIITVNSPAAGQLLQKASTDWKTGTLATGASGLLNNLDVTASGNTSYTYDVEDNYISRKASNEYDVLNNISLRNSSGSYVPVGTTSWAMAYRLNPTNFPTGSAVLFRAIIGPTRYSGSSLTTQFHIGDEALSTATPIGNKAYSTPEFGATAFGLYISEGNTVDITIKIVATTGTKSAITSGSVASIQQITAKQLA